MIRVLSLLYIIFLGVLTSACSSSCSGNNHNSEKEFYLTNSIILSLNEAYDCGYLNEVDLMCISYYLTGAVYKMPLESDDMLDSSKWIEVDFFPEGTLPTLSSNIEYDIKSAYYYTFLQDFRDENGSLRYSKDILEVEYLGCYNNCYVARVDSKYWNYGDMMQTMKFGDIVWQQCGPMVNVFIFKG